MIHAFSLRSLLAASLMVAGGLCASAAGAQTFEELRTQDSQFIDWMKSKGAAEIMEYYAKAYPPKDDKAKVSMAIAVARTQIEAARAKARASESVEEQNRIFVEMRKAIEDLIKAERERCAKYSDDDSALLWQSQLLFDMVDNYLRVYRNNAVEVYAYGSPDPDQIQAYEEWMPLAFVQANQASAVAETFQSKMLSSAKFGDKLMKMGIKTDSQDAQAAVKLMLAKTAYGVFLLPNNHPYYANLGKLGPLSVPHQKNTIADERQRLLRMAFEAAGGGNDVSSLDNDAKALVACVLAAQGKLNEAKACADAIRPEELTDAALAPVAARYIAIKAKITAQVSLNDAITSLRAQAMGNPAIAAELADPANHARAYLFVCDAAHRLLLDASKAAKAPQDAELFNRAFMDPYADVFSDQPVNGMDPKVLGSIRGLRSELNARWQKQFASTPLEQLPGPVAAGTITLEMNALLAPGGLWSKVKKAADEKVAPDANDIKELTDKFRRVEKGLEPFTQHKVKAVRAKMIDQLALLRFLGAQAGIYLVHDPKINISATDQTVHASAMGWLTIASEMPEAPQAAQSMEYAVMILRPQQDAGLYKEDYIKACKVLFEKYPKSNAALRELTKYADILASQGKFPEAEKLLGKMPKEDNLYFVAQQKLISIKDRNRKALQADAESAQAVGRPSPQADAKYQAALDDVIKEGTALVEEAKRVIRGESGYRRASAATVGASTLVLVANAYNAKGSPQAGVSLLDSLEADFPATLLKVEDFGGNAAELQNMQKNLAAQVEWGQICRMRMLMDAGLEAQVKSRAEQLLAGGNPQSIAVLRGLLRDLKMEVDRLQDEMQTITFPAIRAEKTIKRQRYGKAMLTLADLLRAKLWDTASTNERDYLNILQVQAMAASGDTAKAVDRSKELLAEQEAEIKAKKRTGRSLNLLLCEAQANFDHANAIADINSAERKTLFIRANNAAKRITDNYRQVAPDPQKGYPVEFYEAFWIQMSGIASLPVTSPKIASLRKNVPVSIRAIMEADPTGFANLPWNDRFEKLKLRIEVEK